MNDDKVLRLKARITPDHMGFNVEVYRGRHLGWGAIRSTKSRCMAAQIKEDLEAGKYNPKALGAAQPKREAEGIIVSREAKTSAKERGISRRIYEYFENNPGAFTDATQLAEILEVEVRHASAGLNHVMRKDGLVVRIAVKGDARKLFRYGIKNDTVKVLLGKDFIDRVILILTEHPSGLTRSDLYRTVNCAIPPNANTLLENTVSDKVIKMRKKFRDTAKVHCTRIYFT